MKSLKMKKINLINTLKKTFKKKKVVKKTTKTKKPKISKKIKKTKISKKAKVNKDQKKNLKITSKSKPVKLEKKDNSESNENLHRISKSNEQKPEIKKVKKQDTEKDSDGTYLYRELKHSSFRRSFTLGENFESGKIKAKFKDGILKIHGSQKIKKLYVMGHFGMGGSSSFAYTEHATVIVSRKYGSEYITFTVIWYDENDHDPSIKVNSYMYLTENGLPLSVKSSDIKIDDFEHGTIVKHFGYDLTNYAKALSKGSVYTLLQKNMFNPTIPIKLINWLPDKDKSFDEVDISTLDLCVMLGGYNIHG